MKAKYIKHTCFYEIYELMMFAELVDDDFAIDIVYVLYLLIVKKDIKKINSILYPGLFFVAIWGVIYFFLLKE